MNPYSPANEVVEEDVPVSKRQQRLLWNAAGYTCFSLLALAVHLILTAWTQNEYNTSFGRAFLMALTAEAVFFVCLLGGAGLAALGCWCFDKATKQY